VGEQAEQLGEVGQITVPEPPHSFSPASVDDKGRLKLPAEFLEYLAALKVTKVFITTVNFTQVRIYPLSVWKQNEKLFQSAGENSAAMERLVRVAKHFGGDAEIDKSGRVLLPAPLRAEMGLEKQAVVVDVHNGRVNVMLKKVHDEMVQVARASLADDLKTAEKLGFN
jgi:MraZ protein